jgi:uncharacterized membrane protein
MKQIIAVLGIVLLVTPALAADDQQERTKTCNAAAAKKGLTGDKRKAYVKSCVSAKAKKKPEAAAAPKKKQTARPAAPAAPTAPRTGPAQPSATSAAAPAPASADEKKRFRCEDMARQSNVSPSRKKDFMDKCLAG